MIEVIFKFLVVDIQYHYIRLSILLYKIMKSFIHRLPTIVRLILKKRICEKYMK